MKRLLLDGGEGVLHQAAVGVANRLVGVLPTLVLEPRGRAPHRLEEAVTVAVAIAVGPREGPQGDVAVSAERAGIAGPVPELREGDDEHGRGGHGAVVGALGDQVQLGQRSAPHLVDQFARLLVPPRRVLLGLGGGEDRQSAPQHVRTDQRALPAGGEDVPTEQAGVGRHPRIGDPGVRLTVELPGAEREQVLGGALEGQAHHGMRGLQAGPFPLPALVNAAAGIVFRPAPCAVDRGLVVDRRAPVAAGRQRQREAQPCLFPHRRRADDAGAQPAPQLAFSMGNPILEGDRAGGRIPIYFHLALLAALAADLLDVGEVCFEARGPDPSRSAACCDCAPPAAPPYRGRPAGSGRSPGYPGEGAALPACRQGGEATGRRSSGRRRGRRKRARPVRDRPAAGGGGRGSAYRSRRGPLFPPRARCRPAAPRAPCSPGARCCGPDRTG